ncbi:MAG: hypothetical protein KF901_20120 [Myxococcales bacterium]|nr:hypothetical protein [Myxococcales bacterium]
MGRAFTLAVITLVSAWSAAQEPSPLTPPYVAEVRAALNKLAAGDTSGAAAALQAAITRHPARPEAHCHLAVALTRLGDRDGAIESYQTCARLARQAQDPLHEGRGLHGVARLLMDDANRRIEARGAIMALQTFANAHPTVLSPSIPQGFLDALSRIEAADAAAAPVRQRREARRAQGASD